MELVDSFWRLKRLQSSSQEKLSPSLWPRLSQGLRKWFRNLKSQMVCKVIRPCLRIFWAGAQSVSNVLHLNNVLHVISRRLLVRPVLDKDVGLAAEQSVFPLHRSPPELLMSVSMEETGSCYFMHKWIHTTSLFGKTRICCEAGVHGYCWDEWCGEENFKLITSETQATYLAEND